LLFLQFDLLVMMLVSVALLAGPTEREACLGPRNEKSASNH